VNCYGRIRAEVERHLLSNDAPHVILRISKVFGRRMGDGTLISDLCSRLLRDEMVRCAEDQNLSPIFVEELCWLIGTIVRTGYTGTLHAASMDPVTRYALATHIASVLKVEAGKIVPCNINELGLLEPRPVDASLNDSAYRHTFGVEHKDMAYYIRHVLEEHGKGTS
jgi:dTDP-4-dehydrorhamnose reductase